MSPGALAHQRGGLAHDLAALGGHHVAPDLEALLGRFERAVEVGPAGMRHAPDLLAGRRIDYRQCFAFCGRLPFAVDEKLRVDVSHGESSRTGGRREAMLTRRCRPETITPAHGPAPGPHADDAAVPAHQGRASRHPGVLPDGRLLRAVLRRRRKSVAPDRPYAHPARHVGGRAGQDGRRAGAFGRAVPRQAGEARPVGGDRRADRRPGDREGPGRPPGHAHRHARHAHRFRAAGRQGRQRSARRFPRQVHGRPRMALSCERSAARSGSRAAGARQRAATHRPGGGSDRAGSGSRRLLRHAPARLGTSISKPARSGC